MENIRYSYFLKRINTQENKYRFYTIRITPSLFDEWVMVREWGRIGSSGTLKSDICSTEKEALSKMDKLLSQKIKRGYILQQ